MLDNLVKRLHHGLSRFSCKRRVRFFSRSCSYGYGLRGNFASLRPCAFSCRASLRISPDPAPYRTHEGRRSAVVFSCLIILTAPCTQDPSGPDTEALSLFAAKALTSIAACLPSEQAKIIRTPGALACILTRMTSTVCCYAVSFPLISLHMFLHSREIAFAPCAA